MRGLSRHLAEAYKEVMDDPFAFVAVLPDPPIQGVQGVLGVAKANERGYFPIPPGWAAYPELRLAEDHASLLNTEILGLDDDTVFRIIASTMGGRLYVHSTR